jgi:hypothetical protein
MDKNILDNILLQNKAQPVGNGYIDTIINPIFVTSFLKEIINSGFSLEGVSWWEYCKVNIKESKYGKGGVKSIYFDGLLSEIPIIDIDHFEKPNQLEKIELQIKNKEFIDYDQTVMKYSQGLLWPGFWIIVPKEWINIINT